MEQLNLFSESTAHVVHGASKEDFQNWINLVAGFIEFARFEKGYQVPDLSDPKWNFLFYQLDHSDLKKQFPDVVPVRFERQEFEFARELLEEATKINGVRFYISWYGEIFRSIMNEMFIIASAINDFFSAMKPYRPAAAIA